MANCYEIEIKRNTRRFAYIFVADENVEAAFLNHPKIAKLGTPKFVTNVRLEVAVAVNSTYGQIEKYLDNYAPFYIFLKGEDCILYAYEKILYEERNRVLVNERPECAFYVTGYLGWNRILFIENDIEEVTINELPDRLYANGFVKMGYCSLITAKIITVYLNAIDKHQPGAYTVLYAKKNKSLHTSRRTNPYNTRI